MQYNFLILCGLFAVPPFGVALLRPDLRRPMALVAILSLPFAFTEYWFYPDYWRPHFVFELARRVGFGIEDFLFVAALGAFACAAYPFAFGKRFTRDESGEPWMRAFVRASAVALSLLACALVLRAFGLPAVFAACSAMVLGSALILIVRRDLVPVSVGGGMVVLGVYLLLCSVFSKLLPGVFRLAWNTEKLTNRFVLGVPLEELLYGFSAGFAGSLAYPFVANRGFEPRR